MRLFARLLLVLALAWAGAVLWLVAPHLSFARLPARAAVLPAYSTIYLAPAQVRGIDILFGPRAFPAPKSDADWAALESEVALPLLVRNGAAVGAVGGIALLPLALMLAGRALRRHRR
ncbi:hypothetical protein [Zavarzinia compransoris]|uniref:Uncharacterized protein n=1 Tax=Zavarzinia compransoris TaxID=1264899 RepID=A0A317DYH2_9PROT|nr:hypothetical protein [Zavarzinia compransoris]PWR19719.1 hypothetical protein DKG75_14730 [Zavarzinia compransoris]TDP43334.1 hypothetical protein DES42_11235 [Zavarzinia compransoris]